MKTIVTSQLPVMALEIDEEGTVAQKSMQLTRQGQLENTLLDALYPGIRVAIVEIPGAELDDYGRAKVEQALAKFTVGGVEYRLIGASGSAKNGSITPSTRNSSGRSRSGSSNGLRRRSPISGFSFRLAKCGSRSRMQRYSSSKTIRLARMIVVGGSAARFLNGLASPIVTSTSSASRSTGLRPKAASR